MNKQNYIYFIPLLLLFSCSTDTDMSKKGKTVKESAPDRIEKEIISVYEQAETAFPGISYPDPVFFINSIERCLDEPELIPDHTKSISLMLSGAVNATETISILHRLNGISPGGYGPPVTGGTIKLRRANNKTGIANDIEALKEKTERGGAGLSLSENELKRIYELGDDEQKLLADILYMIADVHKVFSSYIDPNGIPGGFLGAGTSESEKTERLLEAFLSRELTDNRYKKMMKAADRQILAFSSRLLIMGLENIIAGYTYPGSGKYTELKPLYFNSDLGRIGIFGSGPDTINQPCMLTIDLGGDDCYYNNCATADWLTRPLSLAIDFEGNDKYGRADKPARICSSQFGLSILLDRNGNDYYYGGSYSNAFTFGGFSLLLDENGDDTYVCDNFGIGSAFHGYSALIDKKGKDSYLSGSYAQGFGSTGGVGLLLESEGNDSIISETGSFCQGASKGRWADAGDGFSLGGGYGILVNTSGDDIYRSLSFSQGASYYHGMGILSDLSGKDTYDAESHSQGAAIHFTTAAFTDIKGNDVYNKNIPANKLTQITGYARDNSYSFFMELSGDDEYHFGNKSFGVGDIEAIGSSADMEGDDKYFWHRNGIYDGFGSFGRAQGLEGTAMSVAKYPLPDRINTTAGIAIDGQGADMYRLVVGNDSSRTFFKDRTDKKILDKGYISIRSDLN